MKKDLNAKSKNFVLVKKPKAGSSIVLTLDSLTEYTAQEIEEQAIKKFQEFKKLKLDKGSISLGLHDGQPIKTFKLVDEKTECGLWDYFKSQKKVISRSKLYILHTFKGEEEEIEQTQPVTELQPIHSLRCEDQQHSQTTKFYKEPIIIDISNSMNNKSECVLIQYCYMYESLYGNNARSITNLDKKTLFDRAIVPINPVLTIEEVDPVHDGYPIINISIGKKSFLEIEVDENLKKTYNFPSAPSGIKKHSILHDQQELKGFYGCNFGIGVIPYCDDDCHPIFTWYKNDNIYLSGEGYYWINVDDTINNNTWTCSIKCKNNFVVEIPKNIPGNNNLNSHKFGSFSNMDKLNEGMSTENINRGTYYKIFSMHIKFQ